MADAGIASGNKRRRGWWIGKSMSISALRFAHLARSVGAGEDLNRLGRHCAKAMTTARELDATGAGWGDRLAASKLDRPAAADHDPAQTALDK